MEPASRSHSMSLVIQLLFPVVPVTFWADVIRPERQKLKEIHFVSMTWPLNRGTYTT